VQLDLRRLGNIPVVRLRLKVCASGQLISVASFCRSLVLIPSIYVCVCVYLITKQTFETQISPQLRVPLSIFFRVSFREFSRFIAFYRSKRSRFSTETKLLSCVKAARGPGSIDADSGPDPESKSGPKWPRLGAGQNGLDPDPFFQS
jgi:hypothetical protein